MTEQRDHDPDLVLMHAALNRALTTYETEKPPLGSGGAIVFLMQEGAAACAEAREQERQLLASAISKFAPDLAAELKQRWVAATLAGDETLNDLAALLRDEPPARES